MNKLLIILFTTVSGLAALAADSKSIFSDYATNVIYRTQIATNVVMRPTGAIQHTTNGTVRAMVPVTNIVLLVDYKGTHRTFVLEQLGRATNVSSHFAYLPPRSQHTNNVVPVPTHP